MLEGFFFDITCRLYNTVRGWGKVIKKKVAQHSFLPFWHFFFWQFFCHFIKKSAGSRQHTVASFWTWKIAQYNPGQGLSANLWASRVPVFLSKYIFLSTSFTSIYCVSVKLNHFHCAPCPLSVSSAQKGNGVVMQRATAVSNRLTFTPLPTDPLTVTALESHHS